MGFPLADVLTSDALVEEFQCKICTELVEYTQCAHTRCGHVFCQSCLSNWMSRAGTDAEAHAEAAMNGTNPLIGTRCPTCNAGIERNTVHDLKLASPLAWRLLGRVQVRCPTHASTKCAWRGDLSEVSSHLTDSRSHGTRAAVMDDEGAEKGAKLPRTASMEADAATTGARKQGNAKFQAGAFKEAIQLYSKAVSVAEQSLGATHVCVAAYYGNRAAAWLHVGALKECVEDCRRRSPSTRRTKRRICAWSRLCASRATWRARRAPRVATKLVPGDADIASVAAQTESLSVHLETGAAQMRDGDFLGALETYLAANAATPCAAATIGAARAETFLGRCDRATRATLSVIREDAGNVSAYAARGHALCLSDDFDQGVKHLKEALRLDPDCAEAQRAFRAMKKAGAALTRARDAVARRAFEEARVSFTETLALADVPNKSPLFAAVVSERAQASLRLRLYEEALADCDLAIAAREDHKRAYYVAGSCLIALGRPNEAAERLAFLSRMDPSDETTKKHHEKAVFETRKLARPKYYEVLGVASVASVPEIKQAYKARCMQWHPDRHAASTDEEKALAERNFKALGEALEIMEDPMKRKLYDEGYDKEAIAERAEASASRRAQGRARMRRGWRRMLLILFFDTRSGLISYCTATMYRVSGRPREHARARGARGETVFLFPRYREVSPRAAR